MGRVSIVHHRFQRQNGAPCIGNCDGAANSLSFKAQKGAIVEVQLNKQTRFKEKGNPKGTNLPAVGNRVVVEAVEDNNVLTAIEVQFSAAK